MKNIIRVICIGHDYEYEVRELLKMFFDPNTSEIIFVNSGKYNNCNKKVVPEEILLITKLNIKNNKVVAISDINGRVQTMETDLDNNDENEVKRLTKRIVKKSLFKLLGKFTNTEVPWGILTGIRPTKIVHDLLERGFNEREMKKNYSLPNQKEITEMLEITQNYTKSMGLRPYYMYRQKHMVGNLENIGYARPDMNVYIIFKLWRKNKL